MQRTLLQNLLLLSLILPSRAFTTQFDRTATASAGARRNNNQRLRQLSARAECPSLHEPRTLIPARSCPFDRRASRSSASFLHLSAASGDESSSSSSDGAENAEVVEAGDEAPLDPRWKRILFYHKYNKDGTLKPDDGLTFKQRLAKAGLSVLLSYGFVSNMSYCVTVSLA